MADGLSCRFLGWLQARGESDPALPADIARLNELGAAALGSGELAARLADRIGDDAATARLLRLHAFWGEFHSERQPEWVEQDGEPAAVTWIEAERDLLRPRPTGPVPALTTAPVPDDEPASAPRRRWGATLALLIAGLVLAGLPSLHSARAARLQSAELRDLRGHLDDPLPILRGAATLAAAARDRARELVALREAQRQAVNRACEGGPACSGRLAELDHLLRMARLTAQAAEADARHPAFPPTRPLRAAAPSLRLREIHAARLRAAGASSEEGWRVAEAEAMALESLAGEVP